MPLSVTDPAQPKHKGRRLRYLCALLTFIFIFWLPDLIESLLIFRSLPDGLTWEARFNGEGNEQDNPKFLSIDQAGRVLATGTSYASKEGGSWLAKHDGMTGRELWRWFSGEAIQAVPLSDKNADVYFAGSESKGYRSGPLTPPFSGTDTDFMVGKLSGIDGTVAWKTSFDGGYHDTDWAEALVLGNDGALVAAGFTPNDTRYYGCVVKLDASNGKEIWRHQTDTEAIVFWHGNIALQADNAGDVVFASTRKAADPFSATTALWLRKVRRGDGKTVWTTEFPADVAQNHVLHHLGVTPEGDFIATGHHAKNQGRSLIVAKFAGTDGRVMWRVEIDAKSHETIEPTCLVTHGISDVIVGARSWNGSLTAPLFDTWTFRLSGADGQRIWSKRDSQPSAPIDAGRLCSTVKLMVGPENTIVSAGSVWNGKSADVRVQWLSGADGTLMKSLNYDGAAQNHDLFRDAALTGSNDVVVAQSSSRCPSWLMPLKSLIYRLTGGPDWDSMQSETNELDDRDPFNYDSVLWRAKFLPMR